MDPRELVAKNVFSSPAYDEKTFFVGVLHERGIWQEEHIGYWNRRRMHLLTKRRSQSIFTRSLSDFQFRDECHFFHLDQNDLCEIESLDREKVYDLRERICMAFEGFFIRKMPNQEACFDERNPLLASTEGN